MKKQIKIHPAILVDNLPDYIKQIKKAQEYTDHVDVDIIDWERTPDKTILVQEAVSIPDKTKMNFDLMMDYPSEAVKILVDEKMVDVIILNINQKENLDDLVERIKDGGKRIGVSLNPENEVDEIKDILDKLDFVQIFLIEPGAQGMPYLPQMLEKADELRKIGYQGDIGVDGSVNSKTIPKIIKHSVDILSVGSALSQADDVNVSYNKLLSLIK